MFLKTTSAFVPFKAIMGFNYGFITKSQITAQICSHSYNNNHHHHSNALNTHAHQKSQMRSCYSNISIFIVYKSFTMSHWLAQFLCFSDVSPGNLNMGLLERFRRHFNSVSNCAKTSEDMKIRDQSLRSVCSCKYEFFMSDSHKAKWSELCYPYTHFISTYIYCTL